MKIEYEIFRLFRTGVICKIQDIPDYVPFIIPRYPIDVVVHKINGNIYNVNNDCRVLLRLKLWGEQDGHIQ